MSKFPEIAEAIEGGKSKLIGGLVEAALAKGAAPLEILNDGMVATMGVIGDKFTKGEIFVPEMLVAARTMKKGVEVLKPKLGSGGAAQRGKCVIGTVAGDLHDIGKNLVGMMIESTGFELIDLGADVSADAFVKAVKDNPGVKIVALSALLTTTMPGMKDIISALKNSGVKGFKVMIGGAPISQEYADQIGADAYTPDAATAAEKAKQLAAS